MEFIKLSKEFLPKPNTLVWCKRKRGGIYLAMRVDAPISENPDSSRYCHWHGTVQYSGQYSANTDGVYFDRNFSDVTVESFCYVETPDSQ